MSCLWNLTRLLTQYLDEWHKGFANCVPCETEHPFTLN